MGVAAVAGSRSRLDHGRSWGEEWAIVHVPGRLRDVLDRSIASDPGPLERGWADNQVEVVQIACRRPGIEVGSIDENGEERGWKGHTLPYFDADAAADAEGIAAVHPGIRADQSPGPGSGSAIAVAVGEEDRKHQDH